jgi:5-deoxy-D-glucuronate isomerase
MNWRSWFSAACVRCDAVEAWPRIGGRSNVFDGLPYTLYLPLGTSFSIRADMDCDPLATVARKRRIQRGW